MAHHELRQGGRKIIFVEKTGVRMCPPNIQTVFPAACFCCVVAFAFAFFAFDFDLRCSVVPCFDFLFLCFAVAFCRSFCSGFGSAFALMLLLLCFVFAFALLHDALLLRLCFSLLCFAMQCCDMLC